MRSLESASLYTQHSAQLEEHIQAQTTNVLNEFMLIMYNQRFKSNPDGNDTFSGYPFIYFETMSSMTDCKVIEGDLKKIYLQFIKWTSSMVAKTENNVRRWKLLATTVQTVVLHWKSQLLANEYTAELSLTRNPPMGSDTYEVVDEDELYN